MKWEYILIPTIGMYFITDILYKEIQNVFELPVVHPSYVYITTLILGYIIYFYFFKEVHKSMDKRYEHIASKMGSFPNLNNHKNGLYWSSAKSVKNFGEKGDIEIDKFRYSPEAKRKFGLLSRAGRYPNCSINLKADEFTKGSLIIGQMGTGKTEFMFNILDQDFYHRAIIHDIKGDFLEKFYDKHNDIIINPYDERGVVWDIFEEAKENPFIGEIFFDNYLNSVSGDQKDFFSASAKDRYFDIFNRINADNSYITSKEKWKLFIDELEKYIETVKEINQNSEKDIVSTMKLVLDFFKYTNFLIQEGVSTFTIKDFLRSEKKLFLLNKQDYNAKLRPYFSGFFAVFINIFLSQKDTKNNFTLFALDEYLTLSQNIRIEDLENLHTLARSKGGMLLPAIQYIPKNDKKEQPLLNSVSHWYIFGTVEPYTTKVLIELFGNCSYVKENLNSKTKTDTIESKNMSISKETLISDDLLKRLSKRYQHISYHLKDSIIYLGYTKPLKDLITKNKAFINSEKLKKYMNHKR